MERWKFKDAECKMRYAWEKLCWMNLKSTWLGLRDGRLSIHCHEDKHVTDGPLDHLGTPDLPIKEIDRSLLGFINAQGGKLFAAHYLRFKGMDLHQSKMDNKMETSIILLFCLSHGLIYTSWPINQLRHLKHPPQPPHIYWSHLYFVPCQTNNYFF